MKVSELIKELQNSLEKHGDREIYLNMKDSKDIQKLIHVSNPLSDIPEEIVILSDYNISGVAR